MPLPATLATAATITTMAGTGDLETRLDRGDWLLPGEVARLLGVDRSTVIRAYLKHEPPKIRYRRRAGAGGYRECHPEDVRRELAARRQVHGEQ